MLEPVSSEQEEVVLLDDDLVMDVYNLSFYELQKKILQVWRNKFLNDHTSLTFIRERLIVVETKKNPNSIDEAKLAFVENEKLAQNL